MYGYKCEYCSGTVRPKKVAMEGFKHKERFILLEDVTIGVCDTCGNRYYTADILHAVHELATGERAPEPAVAMRSDIRRLERAARRALSLAVAGFLAASSLWGAPGSIKSDYAAVIAQLDRTCDWQFCHDKQLRHAWELAGNWLAAYLNGHPAATAKDLDASLDDLDPLKDKGDVKALRHDVLDLGEGDFLVALTYGETGTFFVVGREPQGMARVKWSIDAYSRSLAKTSVLSCWRVEAECGPLYASLTPLPPTGGGHPRFYVDANYAGNGMTIGAQTTFWSWAGNAAHLLAVIEYGQMLDDDRSLQFDGRDLIIPIKEDSESFISSGASPDPQGTWKLRITPRGVQDLGHRWSHPELQWFDELSSAVQKRRDTSALAAPAVARRLKPLREDLYEMLMDWSVKRGKTTRLNVTIGDLKLSFTLVKRGGHLYATAVRVR